MPKSSLKKLLSQWRLVQTRKRWLDQEKTILSRLDLPKLSKEELAQVKEVWKGLPFSEKHLQAHRIYKHLRGFDPHYLPMPLYDPLIIRSLNPFDDACVFVNKGLFGNLFAGLPQPQTFVRRIDGHYFDGTSELLQETQAVDLLAGKRSFIAKPSKSAHGGAGIKIVRTPGREEIKSLLESYSDDFIVQELLEQHEDTAKFNQSSLNTIRIISLFINGRVSILKSAFRCGQNGAEVDNATSGGLMIELNPDGKLGDYGIDPRFEKIETTDNGIQIKEQQIRDYPKLESIVLEQHPKVYPSLHLIAWDFAIDKNGKPVFIEGNTKVPGIFWMQLCSGPIFGERTREVVEYVNRKPGIL